MCSQWSPGSESNRRPAARHGWAAALTRDGLARTDLLAVHTQDEERRLTVELQVKTTLHKPDKISWLLGTKSQMPAASPREWFVLVAAPVTVRSDWRLNRSSEWRSAAPVVLHRMGYATRRFCDTDSARRRGQPRKSKAFLCPLHGQDYGLLC